MIDFLYFDEAYIVGRRLILFFIYDLLKVELSNNGILGVFCVGEEGLEVLVLLISFAQIENGV